MSKSSKCPECNSNDFWASSIFPDEIICGMCGFTQEAQLE